MTAKQSRRQETVYGVVIRGRPCAYCGKPAVNADHVIPAALVRRYNRSAPLDAPSIPAEWLAVVPACFECNIRKGTRRLVPPSWASKVSALNAFFGGSPFRVWDGSPQSPAYTEVHR